MRPDQLPLLTTVSAPAIHPDGTWAVVATSRPDFDADDYRRHSPRFQGENFARNLALVEQVQAIAAAKADVAQGHSGSVPPHLRDAHYSGAEKLGHGVGYRYAHDFPHGVAAQQYLPDELTQARYYEPTQHGNEAQLTERLAAIRSLLRRDDASAAD